MEQLKSTKRVIPMAPQQKNCHKFKWWKLSQNGGGLDTFSSKGCVPSLAHAKMILMNEVKKILKQLQVEETHVGKSLCLS